VIEIFQRPDTAPDTQRGYLRFLQQMCELAAEWLRSQKLRTLGDRQTLWQQSDSFARAAHESLDLKETSHIVANEGRRLIGCDRVSVAIKTGRKCKVQAISGQDTIESRSNIVAALNKLATRVVAAGEPLWHDGQTEDLPPQIEEALEDYVDQSYGRNIAVLPLREPQRGTGKEETAATGELDRDNAHRGEVIGALIVEQIESDLPPEVFHARCDLVYEHGTRAIANSMSHTNLFLMPVWRALGRASWIIKARTLPKTLAVVGLVVGLILAGIFVPLDFDLEAEGTLLPQVRREVFANIDGEVIDVYVKENQVVAEGDPLLALRNPDIEIELEELQGQIQVKIREFGRLKAQLKERRSIQDRGERAALETQTYELETELANLNRKFELKKERAADLVVKAPIAGTVVSWEVEKMLRARPVMTGQVLMEIADLTQPQYLELRMPEKREGHLDEYIASTNVEELEVEYILASDPDATLPARLPIENISLRAESDEEHGAIIKMKALPDQAPLTDLEPSPGTRFTADVKCGRRASGFVLLHEVYEWACKFFF